jgi:hypothetical protein
MRFHARVPSTGGLKDVAGTCTALLQAVDIVRPAVHDFYASLTDEQKAALGTMTQAVQPSANNRD